MNDLQIVGLAVVGVAAALFVRFMRAYSAWMREQDRSASRASEGGSE